MSAGSKQAHQRVSRRLPKVPPVENPWAAYEAQKAAWLNLNPHCSHAKYQQVMQDLAKACDVCSARALPQKRPTKPAAGTLGALLAEAGGGEP